MPKLVLIVVLTCSAASLAIAQPTERPQTQAEIAAEVLFRQAVTLREQGAWDDACAKFRSSQRMSPARGTLLNIAECDERFGDVASAWSNYVKLRDLAEAAGDAERLDIARRKVRELEPLLPRITVRLAHNAKLQGLRVTIDGVVIAASLSGLTMPIDAGEHHLEATAPGYRPWKERVVVAVRGSVVVQVPRLLAKKSPSPEDSDEVVTPAIATPKQVAPATQRRRWDLAFEIGRVDYESDQVDFPSAPLLRATASHLFDLGALELGLGLGAGMSSHEWVNVNRFGSFRLWHLDIRAMARHRITKRLALFVTTSAGTRAYGSVAEGSPLTSDGSASSTRFTVHASGSAGADYRLADFLLLRITPLVLDYGSVPRRFHLGSNSMRSRAFSGGLAYRF